MDFDAAIIAHARWKYRLTDYVDGVGKEELDPATIECDDKCDLGKWIHTCRDCNRSAVFDELKREHAGFHRRAAEIVRFVRGGMRDEARAALSATGPYTKHSTTVINLIKQLKTAA